MQHHALDARIIRTEVLDLKMLEGDDATDLDRHVRGTTVLGTYRHGKHLFLDLGEGMLHIHLGMSGSIHFLQDEGHSSHERLRLPMDRGVLLLDDPRRFGRFGWVQSITDLVTEKGLGPDALSIGEEEFIHRVGGRRKAIKAVLLDQKVVAGIGNLYADEVLFQERLAPVALASQIPKGRLIGTWSRMREVLGTAINAGTDFERFPDDYLLRQRDRGGPCPRCGHELRSAKVGGRTTIYCPFCLSI